MPRPRPPRRSPAEPGAARGFTLLEILVALLVLGLALTALLSVEATGVRLRGQAQEITLATFLAQARMTDAELGPFPELGTKTGDFGEDYPGYRWEMSVTDVSTLPGLGIREVRVAVVWPAGPREERIELTSFVGPPR